MHKNLFQDMVKVNSLKKNKEIKSLNVKTPKNIDTENIIKIKENKINSNSNSNYSLWAVAVACIIFLFFAASYLFSKVTVNINPKVQDISLNQNISASKNGGNGALPFNLIVISDEENKTIQTTEEKDVLNKAQGTVVLYNAFSSIPQKLTINTRLEGSNGKIYLTDSVVSIPGMSKDGKPGSVKVKIEAKDAGVEYNSEPIDFQVVGFKGTSKYLKIYGRSDGPIVSGFSGKFPIISDLQKKAFLDDMKITLANKLLKKATDEIPNDFVLFKDAVFIDSDVSKSELSSTQDNKLNIKLKGTLYGFLFNINKLTKKIAEANIDTYDGSDVFIPNIKNLNFVLSNKDNTSFVDVGGINFVLSGKSKLVYRFDTDKLLKDLLGVSKKDFNKILLNYSNITSADLVIKPIWRMSLPDKPEQIKIIVNYPK